jgi:hypothetical protein
VSGAYYATVQSEPSGYKRRTRHAWWLPPNDRLMPWPSVIVIEESPTDAIMFRYAADGSFGGDTWHEDIAAAKASRF